jgi:DNA adenine methylase
MTAAIQEQIYIKDKPKNLTPILKWAGGKRWLVPKLQEYWSDEKYWRLVEPFCGGLAVALGLMPEIVLLNDINKHLINLYGHVQHGLRVTIAMQNDKDIYYAARNRFNELVHQNRTTTAEMAQLFYYMNRTGFNGLCRFNRKGEFNVPFGKYKTINYAENFDEYQSVFSGWEFTSHDFGELVIDDEDFIYADPPYDVEFTSYAKQDFKWEDQVRLIEWLSDLPNATVISNQATDRIIELYHKHGFELEFLKAPRRISCNGDRKPVIEIIATRNLKKGYKIYQLPLNLNVSKQLEKLVN